MSNQNDFKIIRVPIPTPTLLPHTTTNSYLLGNKKESLLVDAGYDQKETKEELEKALKENGLPQPASIVITHSHPDHAPGVRQLADWDPVVYCHRYEKREIEEAIGSVGRLAFLDDGDILNIGGVDVNVIHGPGHTTGQLNLYVPSHETLIAGDNIVAEGTTWIGAPDGNMNDYLQTLHRLSTLKLKKIGPGHGDWVLNPYEQIEFVINRRLKREKQILALLNEHGKLTSAELTEKIYEDTIHPSVFNVAKRTIEAHLTKLNEEGSILADGEGFAPLHQDD